MQFRIKEVNGKFTPEVSKEKESWEPLSGYRKTKELAQEVIDEYVSTPVYHEYTPTPELNEGLVKWATEDKPYYNKIEVGNIRAVQFYSGDSMFGKKVLFDNENI